MRTLPKYYCRRIAIFSSKITFIKSYMSSTSSLLARRLCTAAREANEPMKDDIDHSIDHQAILSAALRYVPDHGWSQKSIQLALTSLGIPHSSHTLFTRGPDNLIEHFEVTCNDSLLEYMKTLKTGETP